MNDRLDETISLCPECLRRVRGVLVRSGDEVVLTKECPDHGPAETVVWRGPPDYEEWRRAVDVHGVIGSGCPTACGLCDDHRQSTCCLLLEVTQRCDLGCPVCFAGSSAPDSRAPGSGASESVAMKGGDPALEEIEGWFAHLAQHAPGCNVQLSGGEPTVRDDLAAILGLGRAHGFTFFQLNTNGLRLAREEGYATGLAEAGLTTVFLQFDGVDDRPYQALRGRPLLREKLAAIDACAEAGLGVVLVPTLVPGVNDDQIGALVDLVLLGLPTIRGLHLQPISYFGRVDGPAGGDGARRMTLPEVLRAVVEQSDGRLPEQAFRPAACEHPLCSFHGEFLKAEDGRIVPLRSGPAGGSQTECTPREASDCRPARAAASEKARRTAARWTAASSARRCCCSAQRSEQAAGPGSADVWDRVLDDLRGRTFSVTAMAFQDAWTIDLERLQSCCLHVLSRDLRRVPFCAYNLTAIDGSHLPGAWRGRDDVDGQPRPEASA